MVQLGSSTAEASRPLARRVSELERSLADELARAKRQRDGQRAFFEQLLAGKPLGAVLDALIHTVEAEMDGALCSILLLDAAGERLFHGAAPSLPVEYCRQIDGIAIGPTVGSCGTAAALDRTAIVSDIEEHPAWAPFRELARAHGLRACWSVPFHDGQGKVLGTFAFYYRVPREPTRDEITQCQDLAHLAAIAIEQTRIREAHAQSVEAARRSQEDVIRAQSEAIAELSLPLIPITDDVLVMPLIGPIDERRAERVISALLAGIGARGAKAAILDVTGVPVVDAQVGGVILRAANAARLAGARVVVTGAKPAVARMLGDLGAWMGGVTTCSTLKSGIALADAMVRARGA
ncbi:GAF domain-containing protein [Polyangium aurulentum]|uniref:GAF domain-containing protein n=1 Tax=Polyangium aurulentum TaxID=2567896 RepID=UPI0010AEC410|nr:GAF domain-containing protein [Polyangium aurulentum]UQA59428.1 GAF domain-containing protein [Polyangium aurulentum]